MGVFIYFKVIDELVDEGVCSSNIKTIGVGKYGFSLKIALNQYPGFKDAETNHVTTDPPLLGKIWQSNFT
jgi:hypothetical protein